MDLGTIAIVIAVVFLVYRMGIVKFFQVNSDRAISMTDEGMEVMELELSEKRSRRLGKIDAKLSDNTIKRATAKQIREKLKLGNTASVATPSATPVAN